MFKDKKVATFYSNDFEGLEVTEQVIDPNIHHGLADKIGGLALLYRWTDSENMMHSKFYDPALIVAYNVFMNAVDRFD